MERSGVLDGWLGRLPGGRTLLDSPFWRRVLSGAALLLVGTIAGRLTGFVREATLAYRLGVSDATDVAIVSFTYSDLMTNLLIAGSMSAVLIPEFARLRAVHEVEASGSSRDADVVLYWRVLVWVTGAAIAVALCASLGSGAVVRVLAPGLAPAASAEASALMAFSAWAFPGWAVVAVSTAFLQHRGRFGIPALQTLTFNLVAITALVVFVTAASVGPLARAAVVGALLVASMQVIAVVRLVGLPHLGGLALPLGIPRRYSRALLTGAGFFVLPFLVRAIASGTGAGGLATVNFATKMIELPNGTLLAALSVAIFPNLSEAFESSDRATAVALARRGALVLFGVGVFAAIVIAVPAYFWARVLYGRGAVTANDIAAVGAYARVLALGLPAQAMVPYALSLCATQRDYTGPLLAVVGSMTLFALAASAVVTRAALTGLAMEQSLFYWLLAALLVGLLHWRHGVSLIAPGAPRP